MLSSSYFISKVRDKHHFIHNTSACAMSVPRGLPEKPQLIGAGRPLEKFNIFRHVQKSKDYTKARLSHRPIQLPHGSSLFLHVSTHDIIITVVIFRKRAGPVAPFPAYLCAYDIIQCFYQQKGLPFTCVDIALY